VANAAVAGNKILIVDGSAVHVDLLGRWLSTEDIQVFSAENGLHALAKLAFLKPDIVIINTALPDMSGFDLCKKVKQESDETLVLCINAIESENNRLRAEEMGADDYFEIQGERYLFVSKIRSLLRVRRLSRQLQHRYQELRETHELINKQLEMGMLVQRALIPEINMAFEDCELMSRYYPALGIGGDFFNVLRLSDDRFGVVMGDVSGHGIAAAFVTALLNMMIKNIAITHPEPHKLMFHLNNEVYGLFENSDSPMFACVLYAVVDISEGQVQYANAGQCSPFHVSAEDNNVSELELFGKPVGLMRDSVYEVKNIAYQPSDLMIFYTDGLQDALYKDQPDEFTEQMKELLSETRPRDSLSGILETICVHFYRVPDSEAKRMEMDDVSMIVCRL
jgi:sigma-B regulation protein RsbU (phosphoserine phosphatase)